MNTKWMSPFLRYYLLQRVYSQCCLDSVRGSFVGLNLLEKAMLAILEARKIRLLLLLLLSLLSSSSSSS